MVTASVQVYYTRDFKSKFRGGHPKNYIRGLVAMANSAYKNSGIPLRIRAYCIEQINFPERQYNEGVSRRDAFTYWFKGMRLYTCINAHYNTSCMLYRTQVQSRIF
jgi:hypothetical protein